MKPRASLLALVLCGLSGCGSSGPSTPAGAGAGSGLWSWGRAKELNPDIGIDNIAATWGTWNDKTAFVVFSDVVGSQSQDATASGGRSEYRGRLSSPDGRQVEWSCQTADGMTGSIILSGQSYDLAKGSVFVVCSQDGKPKVHQIELSTADLPARPDSFEGLLKSNHEIATCFSGRAAPKALGAKKAALVVEGGTRAGEEWFGNGLAIKFCWCPPGEFKMGEGKDAVYVKLTRGFWLGKFELTQAEYRTLMKMNPSYFSVTSAGKDDVVGVDTDKFPVESVSWDYAAEFCRVLTEQERQAGRLPEGWTYILPTEAQWEFACRAGTQSIYSFGDNESRLREFAWYSDNAGERTHEVGQKQPNPWGLHDMHGNVYEWCRDWYQEKLAGGTDPEATEQASARVCRSGNWGNAGAGCRSADRYGSFPGHGYSYLGFRVTLVQSQ